MYQKCELVVIKWIFQSKNPFVKLLTGTVDTENPHPVYGT